VVEGLYGPGDFSLVRSVTLVIRTPLAGGEGLLKQINQSVWSVNKAIPLASVQTMQRVFGSIHDGGIIRVGDAEYRRDDGPSAGCHWNLWRDFLRRVNAAGKWGSGSLSGHGPAI
jgi:hypothetical protein